MKNLLFKQWLEFADYGFDQDYAIKPKGGTQVLHGNIPYTPPSTSLIMSELVKLPSLGTYEAHRKWNNIVECCLFTTVDSRKLWRCSSWFSHGSTQGKY